MKFIKYNYLNLTEEITKGGSGIEYRDEALNSVFHAEGRAFKDKDKWQYEYFIKDHPDPAGAGQVLGNTHLSVADLNGDGCIDPLSDPSEVLQVEAQRRSRTLRREESLLSLWPKYGWTLG
ncbi:MAG: hypothetical protein R2828_35720 [Saprospiraceae bacterium]